MTELEQLRKMIGEPTEATWTNLMLEELIIAHESDLRSVARYVWESKAAEYHKMVNVSESGSSRSMQQMFEHAIKMAELYGKNPDGTSPSTTMSPVSGKIVRPERV